jgi:hypothetical protein
MTDLEIKEEAKRRFDSMTAEEKLSVWGPKLTEKEIALLHQTEEVGYKQLPYEDQRKFRRMMLSAGFDSMPGGIFLGGMLSHVEKQFHITREDIAKGAKNPYKKVLLRFVFLGLGMAFLGGVLAYLGNRYDWQWLVVIGVLFEGATGILAMRFADVVQSVSRFKKLQKMCMSGEMDEEMIRAEVANLALKEETKICYR